MNTGGTEGASNSGRGRSGPRGRGRGAEKGRGNSGVKPTGAGGADGKKKQGQQTKLLTFFRGVYAMEL